MSKTVFSRFARPRPHPAHRPHPVAPLAGALLACMLACGLPVAVGAYAAGSRDRVAVEAVAAARRDNAGAHSRLTVQGPRSASSVSIPQAYLITEKSFNDWDTNTQDAPAPNTGNVFSTSARQIGIFFKYQGATPNSDTYQFALYTGGGQSIGKGKVHPFARQQGGEALLVPIDDAVALTAGSYQAVLLIDGSPRTRITWTAGQPVSVSIPTSFLITEKSFNDWNPKTQDQPAPNTSNVFPTSAGRIGIFFTYKGARANSDTYQLLLYTVGGQQIGGSQVRKFDLASGGEALLAPLNSSYTPRPGSYQAVLLIDGARAVALNWTVAGAVAVDITKVYLITARSFNDWDPGAQGAPAPDTSRVFGTTTTKVGIYFTYNGATVGKDTFQFALYSASGGRIGSGRVHTFSSSASGEALLLPLSVTGPLSPGSYRAVLLIDGQPKTTLTWTVSTGARVPPVTPPQHPVVPSRGQVPIQPCNAPNLQRVVTCVEPSVLRVDVHLSNAEAQGTSFVVRVDATGTYLLTNKHVVEGGVVEGTQLISPDGKTTYKVLGILANNAQPGTAGDLAIIHIGPTTLRPLAFGDSDTLAQGQTVASIGYGLAFQLGGPPSVTEGIVSAVGRDLNDGFGPVWIQHQSTINHGNSGGPLLDLKGNVVGVNTLGIDQLPGEKGGNEPVQGVFFAIPSNRAQLSANRLIATMENGH